MSLLPSLVITRPKVSTVVFDQSILLGVWLSDCRDPILSFFSIHLKSIAFVKIVKGFNSFSDTKLMVSSTNWLILYTTFPIGFCLIFNARISVAIMNRYGEMGHPCLTPLWSWNQSELTPLLITAEEMLLYRVLVKK